MVHKVKKREKEGMAEFRVFVDEKGTVQVIHDSIVVAESKRDKYDELFDLVSKKLGGKKADYKKWSKNVG
jgi:hypothetical protein